MGQKAESGKSERASKPAPDHTQTTSVHNMQRPANLWAKWAGGQQAVEPPRRTRFSRAKKRGSG